MNKIPNNTNKIESIALDFEGTVVNVEHAHHQAHILSAENVGLNLSLEDFFKLIPHFIGGPDDKIAGEIAELAAERGIKADKRYIHQRKNFHYNNLLKELEIKPRKGFLEFYETIREMGIKCTIGSLTNREQAMVLLEKSGIGELVGYENIVLREDVENPKPAPDVWLATAKKANVNPANQLVFEDSPKGIKGAVSIGAYCIGMPVYNRPDTVHQLLQEGAKRVFMCWSEINTSNLISNINKERSI